MSSLVKGDAFGTGALCLNCKQNVNYYHAKYTLHCYLK